MSTPSPLGAAGAVSSTGASAVVVSVGSVVADAAVVVPIAAAIARAATTASRRDFVDLIGSSCRWTWMFGGRDVLSCRSGAAADDQFGDDLVVGRCRVVAGGETAGDRHDPLGDLRDRLADRRQTGADRGDRAVVVTDDADRPPGAFCGVLDAEGELVAGRDDCGERRPAPSTARRRRSPPPIGR